MFTDKDALFYTLHENLTSCSKLIEAGEYSSSAQSILDLVNFLNTISESLLVAELKNEDSENVAIGILIKVHQYFSLASTEQNSLDVKRCFQEVIDGLAFELPKAVARFACISRACMEAAERIVDLFVERCSPRDMLSILCEAIGSPSEQFMTPDYFMPLFEALRKVLVLIQRRHYAQVKAAVPVILNVLTAITSESENEDTSYEELFQKATSIANSIREVCVKLEDKDAHKLRAVLGLYVLQLMALASFGLESEVEKCLPLVLDLSHFLHYCGLSYGGLITGHEVDLLSKLVLGEEVDDMDCFSQVKLGATLVVIWGYKTSEVAVAARADLGAVIMELQGDQTRRWEALGMLKYIFLCATLPLELKKLAIGFLLHIMENVASGSYDDHDDFSVHIPTLYTSLQAIQMVIMYTSSAELRKNAFRAFKKALADFPTSVKFEVLRALTKNSDSSSMIGILLDCAREEMRMTVAVPRSEAHQFTSCWSPSILELVEFVLRPPMGGPPPLPEFSDAVLSALNLYRFVFITESTGNSDRTGILSKEKLLEAYNDWFLPLRTLVTGIVAANQNDYNEQAADAIFALNPVELVLYRCIELVEEKLKNL